ncbi:epoxyqueuosine reductase QueH [uncultured Treponema sp.]|uniref:epoxyqueuosine reductase QueH n=1 Tax=uncultured Treponema sp. TaxID=162155 RepID=UPI0025DCD7C8|nr:epoxyqueuosine reductase QueH [uncultured Treponema sp.]
MNYQIELEKILSSLKQNTPMENRPKLLLHACCAPCSSYVLEFLSSFFDITILYYNPNIFPQEEYKRRLEELKNFLPEFFSAKENSVKLVEDCYIPQEFYDAIKIKENPELATEPEKGERCRRCYEFRLKRAFEFAQKNNFDYFCTTLSISPFKDSEKINQIGKELSECENGKPKWLFSDFKKKGGFLRSLELSKEFSLYRQQYCGCIFSAENSSKTHEQQEKTEA